MSRATNATIVTTIEPRGERCPNYSLRPSVTELTRFNSPKRPGDSCTTRASRRACTFLTWTPHPTSTRRRSCEPGRRRTFLKSARLAHALGARCSRSTWPTGFLLNVPSNEVVADAKFALSGDDVVERLALLISVSGTNLEEFALNEVVVERAHAGTWCE